MDNDTTTTHDGADPVAAGRVEAEPSSGGAPAVDSSDTGLFAGAILLLIGIVALLIVAIQNSHDVDFEFLWITTTAPLLVVILAATAAGVLIDEAVGLVWRRRRRTRLVERNELRQLRERSEGQQRR